MDVKLSYFYYIINVTGRIQYNNIVASCLSLWLLGRRCLYGAFGVEGAIRKHEPHEMQQVLDD